MPLPKDIKEMGTAVYPVGDFDLDYQNPKPHENGSRSILTMNVSVYLELDYQSKHDKVVHGYCSKNNIQQRNTDGSQISYKDNPSADRVLSTFYNERAETAALIAIDYFVEQWLKGKTLQENEKMFPSVQRDEQDDGYHYDVTCYYTPETTYVVFHCHPPKNIKVTL
ncbi:hypothetical protein ACJJID_08875 [Microbulbifer sp. CnH-101-G]|uniref:hypothetical protein n=1 Tax=Microbulbifer sp. CnH-101-G TaxID=3243393 RepID=UPI0040391432